VTARTGLAGFPSSPGGGLGRPCRDGRRGAVWIEYVTQPAGQDVESPPGLVAERRAARQPTRPRRPRRGTAPDRLQTRWATPSRGRDDRRPVPALLHPIRGPRRGGSTMRSRSGLVRRRVAPPIRYWSRPDPLEDSPDSGLPSIPDEAADVARMRDYRIRRRGRPYRLLRGDFHRPYRGLAGRGAGRGRSRTCGVTGSMAARFDWMGNNDHDNGRRHRNTPGGSSRRRLRPL